jgi:ABC-2 type transport system permease protein
MTTVTTMTTTPVGRATFRHCLRAEWIKIRTMRSTAYVVLGTLLFAVGLAALSGAASGDEYATMTAADRLAFDPVAYSLRSYLLAQITLGLLGGLVVTAEYGTRTIVSTLTAVPHRGRVLAAKVTVLTATALLVGELVTFSSFFAGQTALAGAGAPHTDLTDPVALRAVLGGGLYLVLAALFGLALGALIRSTTATVTTLFGTLLIVPGFSPVFPGRLADWAARYWPSTAGGQIITAYRDPDLLGPWSGLAVMATSVAVLLAAAFVIFQRRDA